MSASTSTAKIKARQRSFVEYGRRSLQEQRAAGGQTVESLLEADLERWEATRLRIWCHRLPAIMIAAQTLEPDGDELVEFDLEDYPSAKGPPKEKDLDDAAGFAVAGQIHDEGFARWVDLALFALRRLYPEYLRRTGADHPCRERVSWLVRQAAGRFDSALLERLSSEETMSDTDTDTDTEAGSTAEPTPAPTTEAAAPPAAAPERNRRERIDTDELRRAGAITPLKGKDYLNHDGLLKLGHTYGLRSVETSIVSWDPDKRRAVVFAVVEGERGRYTGIGDAEPANVNKSIATACLRMAETRAVNRALRLYLGVGMTTKEELPGQAPPESNDEPVVVAEHPSGAGVGFASGDRRAAKVDPSWPVDRANFAAAVKRDTKTELRDLEAYLVAHGDPRPSEMTVPDREGLYKWLRYGGGAENVRTWLREVSRKNG